MVEAHRPRWLVLCTGNRCRSQMAHGWLQHFAGDRAEVLSAGTKPKGVHPLSIEMMTEVGIDISHHTSDHTDQYRSEAFDVIITVCDHAKEACPVFPGAKRTIPHRFEDPNKKDITDPEQLKLIFRKVREEIGTWAGEFVKAELDG